MTAPLTFGQLSVWRSIQALPIWRHSEANVPQVWRLPANTSPDQVAAAWRSLVARHESLRTLFVPDGSGLSQRVDDAEPDCSPTPVPLAASGSAGLTDALTRLASEPMDLGSAYGWRVGYPDQLVDSGRHVLVVLHHMLADGWSFQQLREEFNAALAGDPLSTPGLRPATLAWEQRSAPFVTRGGAAVEHVVSCFAETSPPAPTTIPPESHDRVYAELASPKAHQALVAVARDARVSPQGVVLGLTAVALQLVWGTAESRLTLMCANRIERRWRPLVTSMNQTVPLRLPHDRVDQPFRELAEVMQGHSMLAYRHGVYDVDAVAAQLKPLGLDQFAVTSTFNYMAYDLDSTSGRDAQRELRAMKPRRRSGPRFDIKFYGKPALTICLRIDPAILGQNGVEALLEWYEGELDRLARNPNEPVDRIRSRCAHVLSSFGGLT